MNIETINQKLKTQGYVKWSVNIEESTDNLFERFKKINPDVTKSTLVSVLLEEYLSNVLEK